MTVITLFLTLAVLYLVNLVRREIILRSWTNKFLGSSRSHPYLGEAHFVGEKRNFGPVSLAWSDYWTPVVVISDLGVAKEHYKEHLSYTRDDDLGMGYIMKEWLGDAIATTKSVVDHGRHTEIFRPLLKDRWLEQFSGSIYSVCHDWIKGHIKEGSLKINEDFNQLPLRIISCVIYGEGDHFAALKEISDLHYSLSRHLGTWYTKVPLFRHLPLGLNKQLWKLSSKWASFNRALLKSPVPGSLLFEIANTQTDLSERELLCDLYEAVILNDFGIMLEFGNVLLALAKDQELQERLRSSANNRDDSELLQFVIELSRSSPVLSLTFPEKIHREKDIDGVLVPKGTPVVVDVRSINAKSDRIDANATNPNPRNFHRFGLGIRSCPGRKVAHRALMSFAKVLLEHYTVSTTGDLEMGGVVTPFTPYTVFPEVTFRSLKTGER